MNIRERQSYLDQLAQMSHVSGLGKDKIRNFDDYLREWEAMTRPPISSYLPIQVIQKLEEITRSVRLMNKPREKFQLVNELLEPYGFKPLASGTNRRAFYCERDPYIILKLGSDRVGRSDNISEYHLQHMLKPFVPKIFEVFPSGVVMLEERVETMSEEDYKNKYTPFIFDCIFFILSKGYMMEDIGSNFFKNWGLRMGMGPVILDFPYIYEVDYNRLHCDYVNQYGIKCGGELDYNYNGMNEIICTKCGRRYSAKSLAKKRTGKDFLFETLEQSERKYIGMLDTNIKARLQVGDRTYCYYNETNNKSNLKSNTGYHNKTISYDKNVKRDIIKFLTNMDRFHGEHTALMLAERLGVFYRPLSQNKPPQQQKQTTPLNQMRKEEQQAKNAVENMKDPDWLSLITQGMVDINTAKQIVSDYKNYGITDEQMKDFLSKYGKKETPKEVTPVQEPIKKDDHKEIEAQVVVDNKPPQPMKDPNPQLEIVQPMTQEDLRNMEMMQNKSEILGIPGQAIGAVEQNEKRFKHIKEEIESYFRIHPITVKNDKDQQINEDINPFVLSLTEPETRSVYNDISHLHIDTQYKADHSGEYCYEVTAKYMSCVLYVATIYPKTDDKEKVKPENDPSTILYQLANEEPPMVSKKDTATQDSQDVVSDDPAFQYFNLIINDFDIKNFDIRDPKVKSQLIAFLYSRYMDSDPKVFLPKATKKAKEYVNLRYHLDKKVSDEI